MTRCAQPPWVYPRIHFIWLTSIWRVWYRRVPTHKEFFSVVMALSLRRFEPRWPWGNYCAYLQFFIIITEILQLPVMMSFLRNPSSSSWGRRSVCGALSHGDHGNYAYLKFFNIIIITDTTTTHSDDVILAASQLIVLGPTLGLRRFEPRWPRELRLSKVLQYHYYHCHYYNSQWWCHSCGTPAHRLGDAGFTALWAMVTTGNCIAPM